MWEEKIASLVGTRWTEDLTATSSLQAECQHHLPQEALPAAPGGITVPSSGLPKALFCRHHTGSETSVPGQRILEVPASSRAGERHLQAEGPRSSRKSHIPPRAAGSLTRVEFWLFPH